MNISTNEMLVFESPPVVVETRGDDNIQVESSIRKTQITSFAVELRLDEYWKGYQPAAADI